MSSNDRLLILEGFDFVIVLGEVSIYLSGWRQNVPCSQVNLT